MNHYIQLGLVIAAGALLAACQAALPVPSWSPPKWIHGTWVSVGTTSRAEFVASRYNVVIDMDIGGASLNYDFADGTKKGSYRVYHHVGVSSVTGERYYGADLSGAGAAFTCFQTSGATMVCFMNLVPGELGPEVMFTKQVAEESDV